MENIQKTIKNPTLDEVNKIREGLQPYQICLIMDKGIQIINKYNLKKAKVM